jgi:hypothetical protein
VRKLPYITFILFTQVANATTNYGWVTGLNLSDLKSLPQHEHRIPRPGLLLGYVVEKPITRNFQISASLMYSQLGANMTKIINDSLGQRNVSFSYNLEYIMLPLSVGYLFEKKSVSLNFCYSPAIDIISTYRSYETITQTRKLNAASTFNQALGFHVQISRKSQYDFKLRYTLGYYMMLGKGYNSSRSLFASVAFMFSKRVKKMNSRF